MTFYCCCPPKRDYSTFFCCLPLALAAIFMSLILIWWGSWEIYGSAVATYFPDFATVTIMIVGCFRLLCGLFGILAIICKTSKFMNWLICGYDMILWVCAVSFVYQWIVWGCQLGGVGTSDGKAWDPNGDEIAMMVIFTVMTIIFLACGYWILGIFYSLSAIYDAGGSGWERMSAKELEADGGDGDEV